MLDVALNQSSKRDDLIADLVFLRKGRGLTTDRIFGAGTVEEACGGPQPAEVTRERLVSAIYALADSESRDALLAAYGLLPTTEGLPTLDARRKAYGRQANRGPDTLADREDAAIKELALTLLTAYYAGSPFLSQLPIPHGGYLMDYLVVTTIYRDRRFTEHQQRRRIISLVNGAASFKYVSSNESGSARTVLLDPRGCTVETEYVPGGSVHVLRFPELRRGDVHEFGFREMIEGSQAEEDVQLSDFAGQSFETPTLLYGQEVVFLGDKPPIIWAYQNLSRVERPSTPEKNEVLQFENSDSLRKESRHLYGGLFSGIAWRWQ
ncbi:MAG: hypothetical protein LLG45_09015 [Actinomycetia bacterium]|nr:hypothetical protein [Actinomycetes bacterium]